MPRRHARRLLRVFVTGLLAAMPLAATIAIFWWAAGLLLRWLGPDSFVGSLFFAVGLGVTGSEIAGYAIGVALVAALIFLLGLLVDAGLERGLARVVDSVLGRIPVVRSVYDLAQRFASLLGQREGDGLKSMRPVWCHFGGPAEEGGADHVAVLALLSTPEPVSIGGRPYLGVIVPTAPVPVGGGLLYLPAAWVQPANIGIEALTSIYVSMGITSAQHLGAAPSQAPAPTAVAAGTAASATRPPVP